MFAHFKAAVGMGSPSHSAPDVSRLLPLLAIVPRYKNLSTLLNVDYIRTAASLYLIGAAYRILSFLKELLQRSLIGHAYIKGPDQAYNWMHLCLTKNGNFRRWPREMQIVASLPPSLRHCYTSRGVRDESEVVNRLGRTSETREQQQIRLRAEQKEKDAGRGIFFLPASSPEKTFFFHGRTLFWYHRISKSGRGEEEDDQFDMSFLSFWDTSMANLLIQAREEYWVQEGNSIEILRPNYRDEWKVSVTVNVRPKDSLQFPGTLLKEIFDDAGMFYSSELLRKFKKCRIPHRRGYLFYGPPGTGKTSLLHALASELGLQICALDLNTLDAVRFERAMESLPARCIVAVEDIDRIFNGQQLVEAGRNKVSFSTFINSLDGLVAGQGRLFCMTANHIDKLDPALIRPGRIDLIREIKNANVEQAEEVFSNWFEPEDGGSAEKVKTQAGLFASRIPNLKYSVASIKGYVQSYLFDSEAAMRNIDSWMKVRDEDTERIRQLESDKEASKEESPLGKSKIATTPA